MGKRTAITQHQSIPILAQKPGHTRSNVFPNNGVRVLAQANDPSFDPYACQICGKKNNMDWIVSIAMVTTIKDDIHPNSQQRWLHTPTPSTVTTRCMWTVVQTSMLLYLIEPYQGDDKVVVENGNGLQIKHIGKLTLHAPKSTLHLKHVLNCPQDITNFCR